MGASRQFFTLHELFDVFQLHKIDESIGVTHWNAFVIYSQADAVLVVHPY